MKERQNFVNIILTDANSDMPNDEFSNPANLIVSGFFIAPHIPCVTPPR
jgi:hypothetical protein